nr:MAG TPA: hypothetical protein [Caudoviricetes sp.]
MFKFFAGIKLYNTDGVIIIYFFPIIAVCVDYLPPSL